MTEEKLRTYIEEHSQRPDKGRTGFKEEGNAYPFRVPNGYFDTFADRLMSRLPEQTTDSQASGDTLHIAAASATASATSGDRRGAKHRMLIPRVWRYLAACIVVVFVTGFGIMLTQRGGNGTTDQMQLASNVSELQMQLMDDDDADLYQELDYAMVDNHEIAAYLTEAMP